MMVLLLLVLVLPKRWLLLVQLLRMLTKRLVPWWLCHRRRLRAHRRGRRTRRRQQLRRGGQSSRVRRSRQRTAVVRKVVHHAQQSAQTSDRVARVHPSNASVQRRCRLQQARRTHLQVCRPAKRCDRVVQQCEALRADLRHGGHGGGRLGKVCGRRHGHWTKGERSGGSTGMHSVRARRVRVTGGM